MTIRTARIAWAIALLLSLPMMLDVISGGELSLAVARWAL